MPTDRERIVAAQGAIARADAQRREILDALARNRASASALASEVAGLQAAGGARTEAHASRAKALADEQGVLRARLAGADVTRKREATRFASLVDPCDAEPGIPLALFPVRLETRYTDDRAALRIRIYPDDIHVDALDRGITPDETAAGRAWWTAAWGGDEGATQAAWAAFLASVHPDRAGWVASATTPVNASSAGTGVAPQFPDVGPRERRAAVARLLPDRFVAVAIQGTQRATATGETVAGEVVAGLVADESADPATTTLGLRVPDGAEWLVDYAKAEAQGLAITLPLAAPGNRVDSLFVVGVRGSADAARAKAELEALLTAHRHARGLAIVPQGSATNNTERERSGWQRRAAPRMPRLAAIGALPAADSNAAVVARALGIDVATLADVEGAEGAEQSLALAMNVALWSPGVGGLLDRVNEITKDGDTLDDAMRERARVLDRDHVRGRGPVPAIRVGNQPYGILPVGALDTLWQPGSDAFDKGLLDLMRRFRAKWRQSLVNVSKVRGGATLDDVLLDVLGSAPVSRGLRVRSVLSEGAGAFIPLDDPDDAEVLERMTQRLVFEDLGIMSMKYGVGSLEKKSRPLALPRVHESDGTFIDDLLNGRYPGHPASVLQALLKLAWDAAGKAIDDAASSTEVFVLNGAATTLPDRVRSRVAAIAEGGERPAAREWHAIADAIANQVGESGSGVIALHAPIAGVRSSLGALALDVAGSTGIIDLMPKALGAWARAGARYAELRDSLARIRDMPQDGAGLAARDILVAETLDCASHRLDAWLTAIVDERRVQLRSAAPDGIAIGAYGWIEDLVPDHGRRDGGYVVAPSTAHAVTAGLLRNAYLAHNPDTGGSGAFAVDLSSARVRRALDLLEGMRQGQSLGALLGYAIERALHEAGLDRLKVSLRALAPLVDGKLSSRGEAVPAPAAEAVAASNVVDGVALIERFADDAQAVYSALDATPLNNPYLLPGTWKTLTPVERQTVRTAIGTARDANDALADLLLAEAVHQLAQGNAARAGAALDAAGSGDAPPVDPTVVQTPAQGVPFTHRLMIVATDATTTWDASRPRSLAEPRLEAWAAGRLGSPSRIVVHVADDGTRVTLDAVGMSALDFVHGAGQRAVVEAEIRETIPAIGGHPLTSKRDPSWPPGTIAFDDALALAASLRALMVAARPAGPGDFARSGDPATRTIVAAELVLLQSRVTAARSKLASTLAAAKGALAADGSVANAGALRTALDDLRTFGIASPPTAADRLADVAALAIADAERRLATADQALAGTFDADCGAAAGQAMFGDGFWMLAAIAPPAGGDLMTRARASGSVAAKPGAIRRFVRDVASVRDAEARYADAMLLGDAMARPPALSIAQLATADTSNTGHWIAGLLDPAQPTPERPVTSIVLEAPAGYDATQAVAALVIDEWTDVVPRRERRKKPTDPGTVVDERAIAGLAINANGPSARAPQAILLAISPDGARWTTDALIDTLADTLDLAKIRAVTLERTNGVARLLPALYEASWSLQGESAFDLAAIVADISAILPYVSESKP
ncbi:MAG TPA: hypothetical protein VNB03_00770 [Casimicrobiaceae bacterium]|nr:hypothetical protein [Casimicrobiaceae bacterium]